VSASSEFDFTPADADAELGLWFSSVGDFKRSQTRAAMSMKLGALLELAEKTVVLGSIGKLLVDEIQLDKTEPGQGRVYYDGFGRTDQLMSEAQRCIQDVVFNPSADGAGPDESSPFPADGQPAQFQGQAYDDRRPSVQDQYGSYRGNDHQNGNGTYQSPINDYDHNQADHGLAYPNPNALPEVETGSFAEDFNTPSYNPNAGSDFAAKARDRSSLAYMTGDSDEHHDIPPPMPALPGSAADPGLSPISDRSEHEDLTYQRELEQEQQYRHDDHQSHQQHRRPSAEHYRYEGLVDGEAQYAPVRADATPNMGSHYTPEESPASQGGFHPHDKSVEPLIPQWGTNDAEEGISYNPPTKPNTYQEERPYVPKPGDGAYRGPSQEPPLSATSDRGGNNSRGGSSVGGGSANERPLSPNAPSDAFRPAFVPQKKERPPPAARGESALGSKYGDLGSPSVGGSTPTGSTSGRFALGGGATVGAQEAGQSGYFRAADATSPGSGMELPSQRVKAGAFRRPTDPQYYGTSTAGSIPAGGRYGAPPPLTHSMSSRSAAEEIKEAYRSSAVPMPGVHRSGGEGEDEPQRFDTAPLRVADGRGGGGPRPPQVQALSHSESRHSLVSAYTESDVGTSVSQATYHPVNRVQLSHQVRTPSPAGSGTPTAGSGGRGFGGGGYVTRLD